MQKAALQVWLGGSDALWTRAAALLAMDAWRQVLGEDKPRTPAQLRILEAMEAQLTTLGGLPTPVVRDDEPAVGDVWRIIELSAAALGGAAVEIPDDSKVAELASATAGRYYKRLVELPPGLPIPGTPRPPAAQSSSFMPVLLVAAGLYLLGKDKGRKGY